MVSGWWLVDRKAGPSTRTEFLGWGAQYDGRSLFSARTVDGVGNIWSATMEGKTLRKHTNFDSDLIFSYDVSSDKRRVPRATPSQWAWPSSRSLSRGGHGATVSAAI